MPRASHKPAAKSAADYIVPLNMNGLQGRMLYMPAPENKKRRMLLVYGQLATLERWWDIAQGLNQYGEVTMPDLPGFGGMESFYRIGQEPGLDNFADYLAAFIKLRYKRKRLTIIGMGFGFAVATRMLQRYPDLQQKVELLVSLAGFSHHGDFTITSSQYVLRRYGAALASHTLPAILLRHLLFNPWANRETRLADPDAPDKAKQKAIQDFSMYLWRRSDTRTFMRTTADLLKLDSSHQQLHVPLVHVAVKDDTYLDSFRVEQHLKVIFHKYKEYVAPLDTRAFSVQADTRTAVPLLPAKLRDILRRNP